MQMTPRINWSYLHCTTPPVRVNVQKWFFDQIRVIPHYFWDVTIAQRGRMYQDDSIIFNLLINTQVSQTLRRVQNCAIQISSVKNCIKGVVGTWYFVNKLYILVTSFYLLHSARTFFGIIWYCPSFCTTLLMRVCTWWYWNCKGYWTKNIWRALCVISYII